MHARGGREAQIITHVGPPEPCEGELDGPLPSCKGTVAGGYTKYTDHERLPHPWGEHRGSPGRGQGVTRGGRPEGRGRNARHWGDHGGAEEAGTRGGSVRHDPVTEALVGECAPQDIHIDDAVMQKAVGGLL